MMDAIRRFGMIFIFPAIVIIIGIVIFLGALPCWVITGDDVIVKVIQPKLKKFRKYYWGVKR